MFSIGGKHEFKEHASNAKPRILIFIIFIYQLAFGQDHFPKKVEISNNLHN